MMKQVDLQGAKNGVGLANVHRIIIDRGEKGEVIITENDGKLSVYGKGRVLYTEESRRVTRGTRGNPGEGEYPNTDDL